ncbi:MAG: hypothetical protein J7501_01710 [Bdellovibrio sp.]|nr:hypothetical protein [Bdellovibrio sp.]
MKNLNTQMMVLVAAFAMMGVGCSNKMSAVEPSNTVVSGDGGTSIPTAPDGTDSGTDSGSVSYSNEATFTPVSINEMNMYVGTHPMNDPQNFKLKLQLQDVGNGRYAGTVNLSYTDTGVYYNGTFTADAGRNQSLSGLKDNNTLVAEYNRWFTYNGKAAFTGFFQDTYGAIVVVVDNVVNQGDGQGGSIIKGSVYWKNFAQMPAGHIGQSPYRSCWFIYNGPWNCRSSSVINKSSTVPSDGYRKLGTFSGMSKSAAFQ